MEEKLPLNELGMKIRKIRKENHLNQVDFYKQLFPNDCNEDENIKKKMNAIENGKNKTVNYEFLFQIHNRYEVSIDYLLGFEHDFPNYENRAASLYTGLNSKAIQQLHMWNQYRQKKFAGKSENTVDDMQIQIERERQKDSEWILDITSKLFEPKNAVEEKNGITDLSILYDLYMLSLDAPSYINAIPKEVVESEDSILKQCRQNVEISSTRMSYSDSMGEMHLVNINDVNRQVWKERLMKDVDDFIKCIKYK